MKAVCDRERRLGTEEVSGDNVSYSGGDSQVREDRDVLGW